MLEEGAVAGDDPLSEHAWRGVRKLSEEQIEKLAEEVVRQVKLRGPFLNMTEFINRQRAREFGRMVMEGEFADYPMSNEEIEANDR